MNTVCNSFTGSNPHILTGRDQLKRTLKRIQECQNSLKECQGTILYWFSAMCNSTFSTQSEQVNLINFSCHLENLRFESVNMHCVVGSMLARAKNIKLYHQTMPCHKTESVAAQGSLVFISQYWFSQLVVAFVLATDPCTQLVCVSMSVCILNSEVTWLPLSLIWAGNEGQNQKHTMKNSTFSFYPSYPSQWLWKQHQALGLTLFVS